MKIKTILILLISFHLFTLSAIGQNVIQKSTKIEVIEGKAYYIHVIQAKQTLYSISKCYNMKPETILKINNKKDNNLKIGEKIKIPVKGNLQINASSIVIEDTMSKEVAKLIHEEKLKDSILTLKKSVQALMVQHQRDSLIKQNGKTKKDTLKKNLNLKKINIKKDSVKKDSSKKVIKISTNGGPKIELYQKKAFCPKDKKKLFDKKKNIKIGLFIPFYLDKNKEINKSENDSIKKPATKVYNKSELFINYYQGMLLACQDLRKTHDLNIDIDTFDSAKNIDSVKHILDTIDINKYDFIVGPPYAKTLKLVSDKAKENHIPIISPLSDNSNAIRDNKYAYQINTSKEKVIKKTADYIYNNFKNANYIIVNPSDTTRNNEMLLVDELENRLYSDSVFVNNKDITFARVSYSKFNYYGIKYLLKNEIDNIIIVPTSKTTDIYEIIPKINALTKNNNHIRVIGFPSWQRLKSLDPSTLFSLNTLMLNTYFVDYRNQNVKTFIKEYREKYNVEPSTFSFRGYDIISYFTILTAEGNILHDDAPFPNVNLLQANYKFSFNIDDSIRENIGLKIINYSKESKVVSL